MKLIKYLVVILLVLTEIRNSMGQGKMRMFVGVLGLWRTIVRINFFILFGRLKLLSGGQ